LARSSRRSTFAGPLRRQTLFTREQVESRLRIELKHPAILCVYHPVTLARDTVREADALFEALENLPDRILFCYQMPMPAAAI